MLKQDAKPQWVKLILKYNLTEVNRVTPKVAFRHEKL